MTRSGRMSHHLELKVKTKLCLSVVWELERVCPVLPYMEITPVFLKTDTPQPLADFIVHQFSLIQTVIQTALMRYVFRILLGPDPGCLQHGFPNEHCLGFGANQNLDSV